MGFGRRSAIDNRRLRVVSGRLGDAAIDPSIWPEIMEEISAAVGSTGAMLLQSDVRTPDVPRTAPIDEALRAYFDGAFHLADVRAERGVPLLLSGSPVVIDQDFVTPDDIRSDAMYNEVLIPQGLQWFAGIGFRAETALWVLCIQRTIAEGPFEHSDKRILATLSDRLTEVATLSTVVGRIALSSATDALGAVDQAAISIDRFALLLHSNEAAADLFDSELCIRNRRLFAANPRSQKLLQLMFDRLRNTPDTLPFASEPVFVPRQNKAPVLIRTLQVPGAARAPFLGARAILTFAPIEPKVVSGALLAKTFTLTPAEGRVAALIAQGIAPERAAERLGVSRETVRNQLRAVFAKTGTHRQSELVALLARF
jgi:DNA-binding CsgD family transcriptional regulator